MVCFLILFITLPSLLYYPWIGFSVSVAGYAALCVGLSDLNFLLSALLSYDSAFEVFRCSD
jgi:hypothetical protein